MRVPKSSLTKPRRFLLEFAPDGFRSHRQLPSGEFELIAASPKAVGSDLSIWTGNVLAAVLKTTVAFEQTVKEITK